MMDAVAAAKAAQDAINSLDAPAHRALLEATASAVPEVPLFVRRLDHSEPSYYLATWRNARGIVAIVKVDAASGAMCSSVALDVPVAELVLPEERAASLATAARGQIVARGELVWRPCRESISPFQPLYRFETDQGDIYVTASGATCDELTPLGRGG